VTRAQHNGRSVVRADRVRIVTGSAVRIVSIADIPVYVHASWLAVYGLLTWTLAVGYFPRALPGVSTGAYWVSGLIAALLLFASVLLHEVAHAVVARGHGLRVRGITLHVFGGVSALDDEPPTPRAEFLIAIVGPVTSFATAGALAVLAASGVVPAGVPAAIVQYLVGINIAVGVFNLVPGFPLDGGRLLRAALWQWQGSLPRATYRASQVGTAFAFALMGLGTLQVLAGALVGGLWLIFIGLFLRTAADAGYAQVALRETLGRLIVRDVMTQDVVTVAADASVTDLEERFWAHHFTSFPVVAEGRVEGVAVVHDVRNVAPERRPDMRVREIMRPLSEALIVAQGDGLVQALEKASGNGLGRLAVLESGRLVGYLSVKDITHVLALRGRSFSRHGPRGRARGPGRQTGGIEPNDVPPTAEPRSIMDS
jgi:Zn-dependent protease/CBS domain-containing protein